ncbi:MAG: lipoprotein transmembrane [Sphingomonadaceae bacterium]|nr:lipoprotein transmembrane [Sphingomonadaceae bacterium]MBL45207.1 lipoprotein transmembrane [Sphingomonadaceae bacterium]
MILAGLAACATPFKADVSRYQTQLPAPQGESYYVVADDPALAGGLEFAQYANLVEAQMARLGYAEAASPEDATLLVRFDYGVDNGRERVRTTGFHDPFYSPWYGYRSPFGYRSRLGYYRPRYYGSRWGYGFYDPWFGGPEVRSYTVYTSGIDMKIDRAATGERLFEGKAQAVSTSNRLQYLVPNLVEAMFTDFPGNSGETLRISIAPEKTTVRRID